MARASMAALIGRVRLLVSDPAGAGQKFTDDQVQDALDITRREHRYLRLSPVPTITPAATRYFAYLSPVGGDWEADEELVNGSYSVIVPSAKDELVGRWEFSGGSWPNGVDPPVYINGKTYDPYLAAADLLEKWLAIIKLEFDFTGGDYTVGRTGGRRSQKFQNVLALAQQYRGMAKPQRLAMRRGDASE